MKANNSIVFPNSHVMAQSLPGEAQSEQVHANWEVHGVAPMSVALA